MLPWLPEPKKYFRFPVLKNFSLFIALRYLKPRKTYVSIITLISVVGVTLGVTVLIVVIAVMTGFEKRLEQLILGFEPSSLLASLGILPLVIPKFENIHDIALSPDCH